MALRAAASLVGAMDKCVHPCLPTKSVSMSNFAEKIHFIPVMADLWQHLRGRDDTHHTQQLTRDDAQQTLNAWTSNIGDVILDEDPGKAFVSKFGAHWDSITPKFEAIQSSERTVPTSVLDSVRCELCNNTAEQLTKKTQTFLLDYDAFVETEREAGETGRQ